MCPTLVFSGPGEGGQKITILASGQIGTLIGPGSCTAING